MPLQRVSVLFLDFLCEEKRLLKFTLFPILSAAEFPKEGDVSVPHVSTVTLQKALDENLSITHEHSVRRSIRHHLYTIGEIVSEEFFRVSSNYRSKYF